MRPIKYRAWDERNNEMVYSDETPCFYINTKGVLFMYAIPKSESGLETLYHKSYDVDQFTGLTDKDGTDWYEGDVILWGENYEEIIFDTEIQGFCTESSMLCKDTMVLVGNKFQSPELIESNHNE